MDIQGFEFSSALPVEYLDDLEALMFFNPLQALTRTDILRSMEAYGSPKICAQGDLLRVTVGTLTDVQVLFALADTGDGHELAGMVLYVRTDVENILVLHIAVTEQFSSGGSDAAAMLVVQLLDAVRVVARQLKGVRSITIVYGAGSTLRMSVRVRPGAVRAGQPARGANSKNVAYAAPPPAEELASWLNP